MNNYIKQILVILIIAVSFLSSSASEEELYKRALEGIDYVGSLQYEKALQVFDELIAIEPENPRGYFLKSATYFWMFSADMHNEELGETFKNLSYQAVEVAEKKLDQNEDDIDAMFFLGGAYGSLGRYYGLTKSFLKAYWYGKKGYNYLEDVVEMDSTYYDAYLGLGIFNYLADVLPRVVKILSFILGIDGDRALGIKQLNLAVNKGTYTKIEAMFFLGAIYTYREKNYGKALSIWHKLINKFPNNPGILIHMGRCYGDMGNCAKALQIYEQIAYIIDRSTLIPVSSVNYQMGRIQYKLNQFDDALKSFHKSVESDTGYAGHHRWTYPWSHYFLGLSYDMIGERVKSKYHYQQVNDDHSDYVYNLSQNRLEHPLDSVSREITKGKNHIGCREYEKGLQVLQSAGSQLHDQDSVYAHLKWSEIRYYVGQIRYFQTRYQEAISIFDELLNDESIEDEWFIDWVYYYRGNCHRSLGNIDLASKDYDRAEDSDNFELPSKVERAQQLLKAQ